MKLTDCLAEYISACFSGLWIESQEHEDALSEITSMCRDHQWRLATWDIDQGLQIPGQPHNSSDGTDPLAAIRTINALASADSSALLVLTNFHRFLNSAEVVQALARQITSGKQNRTFVVILSPLVQIPVELEKHFVVVPHELPDREQLTETAQNSARKNLPIARPCGISNDA